MINRDTERNAVSSIERLYEAFRIEFAGYAKKALRGNESAGTEVGIEPVPLHAGAQKRDGFDPHFGTRGLYAWLLAILRRVCWEMIRKPSKPLVDEYDFDEHPEQSDTCEYTLIQDDHEAEYQRHLLRNVIATAKLTNLEWACVTASLNGVPHPEIAASLGMQPRTVSAHIRNATPRLRQAALSAGGYSVPSAGS